VDDLLHLAALARERKAFTEAHPQSCASKETFTDNVLPSLARAFAEMATIVTLFTSQIFGTKGGAIIYGRLS
jgi:hypothetical protein